MWLRDRERRLPGESQVAAEWLPACAETNLVPDGSYRVSGALGAWPGQWPRPYSIASIRSRFAAARTTIFAIIGGVRFSRRVPKRWRRLGARKYPEQRG